NLAVVDVVLGDQTALGVALEMLLLADVAEEIARLGDDLVALVGVLQLTVCLDGHSVVTGFVDGVVGGELRLAGPGAGGEQEEGQGRDQAHSASSEWMASGSGARGPRQAWIARRMDCSVAGAGGICSARPSALASGEEQAAGGQGLAIEADTPVVHAQAAAAEQPHRLGVEAVFQGEHPGGEGLGG